MSSDNKASAYWHANHSQDSETERLDALSRGLKDYMDGKLCLAPLGDFKPSKILELGAGTGYWAVEAATLFPDAEVLATDINPLPERPLPSNIKFMHLNILEPIPLEPASYDLIHARFLFIHLPDPYAALARVIALLKPGGWFLIEDTAIHAEVEGDVPGIRAAFSALRKTFDDAGKDAGYGAYLGAFLRDSGAFDVVKADQVPALVSPPSDDPKLRVLGDSLRASYARSLSYAPSPALIEAGYTPEMHALRAGEWDGKKWSYKTEIFIVGAQKKV